MYFYTNLLNIELRYQFNSDKLSNKYLRKNYLYTVYLKKLFCRSFISVSTESFHHNRQNYSDEFLLQDYFRNEFNQIFSQCV